MGDNYTSVTLAFVAALIGIFGNTWDPKKRGLKKLRFWGWVAISLGLLTLTYNCYQISSKHREDERRRHAVTSRLAIPVRHLLIPLENLLHKVNPNYNGKNSYLIIGDHQKDTMVHYLKYKPFLEELEKIKVKERPFKEDTSITWEDHFKRHTAQAEQYLNYILAGSSRDLDTETFLAITAILDDNVFHSITHFKPKVPHANRTKLDELYPFEESDIPDLLKVYNPTNWYDDYLEKIKTLYDIVEKNKNER